MWCRVAVAGEASDVDEAPVFSPSGGFEKLASFGCSCQWPDGD